MPTLDFKGKQFIYSHHHNVPFRELVVDADKSLSDSPSVDDNLVIHGDNLHGLKALLPLYAGKIKCIYIDPPYNTGNEGWCYNDNVNSPLMKEWLAREANPVSNEDLERHDKWLCMMYPRLKLLHELLSDDGVIFVSIDDNEVHHLRAIMDEIWGEENFVAEIIWNKKNVVQNDAKFVSVNHEYIISYRKQEFLTNFNLLARTEEMDARYENHDNDPRGEWTSVALQAKSGSDNNLYEIVFPNGVSWKPVEGTYPRLNKASLLKAYDENRLWFGKSGQNVPRLKKYLAEVKQGIVANSLWVNADVGSTQTAKENLKNLISKNIFETPKPKDLIKRVLQLSTNHDSIILDSFAGSGTTAHAVLDLNKEDGGNRKFILIECEDYADTITAERVRRVIKGVPTAKDEKLQQGLGGSFTFVKLGDAFSIEKMLTGENLPEYSALANYVFYTATGISLKSPANLNDDFYVGETDIYQIYLIYKPDIAFLRSNDSALNGTRAELISKHQPKGKTKLVFATAKYMSQKDLTAHKITFCQLPYSIHRIIG
ncbi:MAG: site-specific DNA-methyltransferase [Alphaproteobacteria bacterium]|nr:site-specific DNA-methyltransferase [Alphaproteobacteria bacterium]